jgi:small subunit ribosomal protein S3
LKCSIPGGKKGKTINALTETLKREFQLENPQISVVEVRNPTLEPRLVAKKAAKYIEMGKKVRAVLHFLLKDIMRNGALGAEIVASGKIGAKGARSKRLRVANGYIPKAGEPARLVNEAHVSANTKSGIIGVLVRIAPPGTVFPDKPSTQVQEAPAEKKKEGNGKGQPVERVQGPPKEAKAKPEAA